MQGQPAAEIGSELQMTIVQVYRAVHDVRRRLRAALADLPQSEGLGS
jgi:hypothetical protein